MKTLYTLAALTEARFSRDKRILGIQEADIQKAIRDARSLVNALDLSRERSYRQLFPQAYQGIYALYYALKKGFGE